MQVIFASRRFIWGNDLAKSTYMSLYLAFSFIGVGYDYFFFAFHLLDLLFKISLLRTAVNAILRNCARAGLACTRPQRM
jgi:hypothetical protein